MNTPLQAAIAALISQAVALVVGFGIVNNTQAGAIISVTVAAVNVAFLIAHGLHAQAAAKVKAAQLAPPRPIRWEPTQSPPAAGQPPANS